MCSKIGAVTTTLNRFGRCKQAPQLIDSSVLQNYTRGISLCQCRSGRNTKVFYATTPEILLYPAGTSYNRDERADLYCRPYKGEFLCSKDCYNRNICS